MSYKKIFLLFATIIFVQAYTYSDENILTNPGFEKGKEGWSDRTCAIEAVSSPVHSGNGAIRVFKRFANWQGIKQSIIDKMVEGKAYKISGWIKLENAKSDNVAISIEQQDDSGINYHGVARGIANDSAWIELSGEFTLKKNGTLTVLDIYVEGPAPGVNFYVDDVSVYGPVVEPPKIIVNPKGKINIDANIKHQKIEGFGASGAWYTKDLLNHQKKEELFKLLFKDLGLDIFRISNYYDFEPDSYKEALEITKKAEAVLGRKLKLMISSWSPPPYLKSNSNIVGGTLKKVDGKFVYDEFAEWWYRSILTCKESGVKVDYINIQNEPDYEAPYNSCVFTPSEVVDTNLAAYNKALESVWKKLNKEFGSDMPKLLAPEASSLGHAKRFIEHLDNLSIVYGFSTHLYDCSGCGMAADRFIPSMKRFYEFASQLSNKPIFQTEFENGPGTWEAAFNTALVIHNALTVANVSAYLYWDLFWGPGSGLVSLNDSSSYTITPSYYAFKQYSAFIDADWQRIEASSDNIHLKISAYMSPDNKKMCAVLINSAEQTDISSDIHLKDFKFNKSEIYRTSKNENCILVGKLDKRPVLKIPAYSITTILLTTDKK